MDLLEPAAILEKLFKSKHIDSKELTLLLDTLIEYLTSSNEQLKSETYQLFSNLEEGLTCLGGLIFHKDENIVHKSLEIFQLIGNDQIGIDIFKKTNPFILNYISKAVNPQQKSQTFERRKKSHILNESIGSLNSSLPSVITYSSNSNSNGEIWSAEQKEGIFSSSNLNTSKKHQSMGIGSQSLKDLSQQSQNNFKKSHSIDL